eukprot:2588261-Pyramimonas_sp.AAC.1
MGNAWAYLFSYCGASEIQLADALAENHKGLLKYALTTARCLGFMASRAVRLYTLVGEMAQAPRKQVGPVIAP